MTFLKSSFKDSLTGPDDAYEIILIATLLALLVGLGLSVYVVVVKSAAFSLTDFGIGVGSLLGGAGVGYGAKKLGERNTQTGVSDPSGKP